MLDLIILPVLAFFVGIVAAMLGIGGGVFVVPALQLLPLGVEFSPQWAAGTSLMMIVMKALSSTGSYARQRRIDYRIGLVMAIATIPGALFGASLTEIITEETLILIFAIFLLYVALRMIFRHRVDIFRNPKGRKVLWARRLEDADGKIFRYNADMRIGLPLGFLAGVSAGLLGIGGGSLMVPILHFALSFPIHIAVATSVFVMIFTSLSGVATHFYLGNVKLDYALLLGAGVVFGAQVGAYVAKRVSSDRLRQIFGCALILVSLRMILKFLESSS